MMRLTVRRRRKHPGFTLVEMLIVVAIVCLVLGLSWPALRRPAGKATLREAAKQLRADLVRARLEAMRTGVPWILRWQVGGVRYHIGPVSAVADLSGDLSGSSSQSAPKADQGGSPGDLLPDDSTSMSAYSSTGIAQAALSRGELIESTLISGIRFAATEFIEEMRAKARGQSPVGLGQGTADGVTAAADGLEGATGVTGVTNELDVSTGRLGAVGETGDLSQFSGRESGLWNQIIFLPHGRSTSDVFLTLLDPGGYFVQLTLRSATGGVVIGPVMRIQPRESWPHAGSTFLGGQSGTPRGSDLASRVLQ